MRMHSSCSALCGGFANWKRHFCLPLAQQSCAADVQTCSTSVLDTSNQSQVDSRLGNIAATFAFYLMCLLSISCTSRTLNIHVGQLGTDGLVGYDDALTRRRSRVRTPVGVSVQTFFWGPSALADCKSPSLTDCKSLFGAPSLTCRAIHGVPSSQRAIIGKSAVPPPLHSQAGLIFITICQRAYWMSMTLLNTGKATCCWRARRVSSYGVFTRLESGSACRQIAGNFPR